MPLSRTKAHQSLVRSISNPKPLARPQSKSPSVEALAPHPPKSRCHLRLLDLQLQPEELSSLATLHHKAQARCSSRWASAMPHLKVQASHSLWTLVRRLHKAQARFSLWASEASHLKCSVVLEAKPNQLPKIQPQDLPSSQEALGNLVASELQLSNSKALVAVVPSMLEVSLRQCPQPCWNQESEKLQIKQQVIFYLLHQYVYKEESIDYDYRKITIKWISTSNSNHIFSLSIKSYH